MNNYAWSAPAPLPCLSGPCHRRRCCLPQVKEPAISTLADLYAAQGDAQALRQLLTELRPLFAAVPKAKTAKIVRGIIETVARVPNSGKLQVGFASFLPACIQLSPVCLRLHNVAARLPAVHECHETMLPIWNKVGPSDPLGLSWRSGPRDAASAVLAASIQGVASPDIDASCVSSWRSVGSK